MKVEGVNVTVEEALKSIDQFIDFIFIIRHKFFEIENNDTQKFWFEGYIAILNITINNGTDNIEIFYDKNLN